MTKSVALVVQRYGEDIVGGAESHARALAEQLHTRLGWNICVLTTCAQSYQTWSNHYPAGESMINGILVKRFPTRWPRVPFFSLISRIILGLLRTRIVKTMTKLQLAFEWIWIVAQGPYCPDLVSHLEQHQQEFDLTIFFTYLYYPTVATLSTPSNHSIFIPTSHDEPALYFKTTHTTFSNAKHIFANSVSEAALIAKIAPHLKNISVVGLGIETSQIKTATGKQNYVLYLGRISRGKGVDILVDWFTKMRPDCKLVLAGVREDGVTWPENAPVEYLGVLNDHQKYEVIAKARCMINPSPLESLSLIVLEAVATGVPVLVNRNCEILAYYEQQMPSVFGYRNRDEFQVQLASILAHDWTTSDKLKDLAESRRWVDDHYSWNTVLKNFSDVRVE